MVVVVGVFFFLVKIIFCDKIVEECKLEKLAVEEHKIKLRRAAVIEKAWNFNISTCLSICLKFESILTYWYFMRRWSDVQVGTVYTAVDTNGTVGKKRTK